MLLLILFDDELLRINKIIENQKIENSYDKLYIDIYNMMQSFEDIDTLKYDKTDKESVNIYKTAEILLNKKFTLTVIWRYRYIH